MAGGDDNLAKGKMIQARKNHPDCEQRDSNPESQERGPRHAIIAGRINDTLNTDLPLIRRFRFHARDWCQS